MKEPRYPLNYSQDIVLLQTKYSLFKRVLNILFSVKVDGGFDKTRMEKALTLLYERNDCLRIRFVKEGGQTMQFIEQERRPAPIPSMRFSTHAAFERFLCRWRRKPTDPFKGDVLRVIFVEGPAGKSEILFKICHLVADTYGIGVLIGDLFAVYEALKEGKEMPAAPGSFEEVLVKDAEHRADIAARDRDRSFFEEFYTRTHQAHPEFCGITGEENDRWLKDKCKGHFSIPYLFVRCDTEGYRFVIPASVVRQAQQWCQEHGITPTAFYFYAYAVAASLKNDRAPHQIPLLLLNGRGTLAERKAAGTKVQSLAVYTDVDWNKSFAENLALSYADQNELYRHTRLTYLEIEEMQHRVWKYSMLRYLTNYCFSFIPVSMPEGVSMQVHSNGKGALPCYIALMHNVKSDEIYATYDIQTKMYTGAQLADFHCLFVSVIENVIAASDQPLSDLFRS